MRFRPCIDIHNGKVKQIVGGSLQDQGDLARENFVSEKDAGFYADFYEKAGLEGGHMIMLNPPGSSYYEADRAQALRALSRCPGRWQIGGGIRAENAAEFLEAGASHVIVTSYVFRDGQIYYENLERLVREVGKEHLVLDLSCRRKREGKESASFMHQTDPCGDVGPVQQADSADADYFIVTDRWQKFTDVRLCREVLDDLGGCCDEFLIHAADVEGKARGIEEKLAAMLGKWRGIPVTYAGGVGSYEDLRLLKELGQNRLDVTVGSALDLFGGSLSFKQVLKLCEN